MPDQPIHILCAADRAFLRHVPVMLASVRARTAAPLRVSIVSTDWRPEDQRRLTAALPRLNPEFLSLPMSAFDGLPFKMVLSPLSYARVLMSDMVDSDRFLYLDIDMILRDDVAKLWSTDLGEAPAAAVFHGGQMNAGMMLVNARVWRARGLAAQVLDWARQNQPKEADQAAIEAVMGPEILHLDPRWNRLVDPVWGPAALGLPGYREEAAILHFITGFKPWNLGRWLLPRAYAAEWRAHCRPNGLPFVWKYEAKTLLWQIRVLAKRALGR